MVQHGGAGGTDAVERFQRPHRVFGQRAQERQQLVADHPKRTDPTAAEQRDEPLGCLGRQTVIPGQFFQPLGQAVGAIAVVEFVGQSRMFLAVLFDLAAASCSQRAALELLGLPKELFVASQEQADPEGQVGSGLRAEAFQLPTDQLPATGQA